MKAPKRMASGKYLDLANLQPEDILLSDINTSLNTIYRFTGHYKDAKPLTVAQHTRLVMWFSERVFPGDDAVLFDCLLHDMPEAYYGDVATPWKHLVGDSLRQWQNKIDATVYERLWVLDEPFTEEIEQKRKVCDLLALDVERRTMWRDQKGKNLWPETPSAMAMSVKEKEDLFFEMQAVDFDMEGAYDWLLG